MWLGFAKRERQEFSPVRTSHRVKEGLAGKCFRGPCPGQDQGSVRVSRKAPSELAVNHPKGGRGGWPPGFEAGRGGPQ